MRDSRALGFSLIELMVTIAIVAILLAVAFPSFEGSMRSNRVATGSNELMASMSLARSEAIRSPGGSGLCVSTDGVLCSAVGTWNDGWIIWREASLTSHAPGGVGDRVMRYIKPNNKLTVTATASATGTSGGPTLVRFDPRGRMIDSVTHVVTLVPSNCPSGQGLLRTVALNPTGQARISKGNCT